MFRKILFFGLIIVVAGSILKAVAHSKTAMASPVTVGEKVEKQVLEATMRITMYAPLTDEQGSPLFVRENGQRAMQLTVNEGLGTLARQGSDLLIITHDHWLLLTPDLRRVQFHSAADELLLEISGEQFLQLVRYQDGGTMVLAAPQELAAGRVPVSLGDSSSAGRDDIVYLAHRRRQEGRVSVAAMLVQKTTTYNGQPVFRLTSLNGEVVLEGNSGGGIVADGLLVGNMWGTILVEDASGSGANSARQTTFSLAAQLPAGTVNSVQ